MEIPNGQHSQLDLQFYSTSIPTERIFLHLVRLRTKQGILRFGAAATKFSEILILKPGK